MSKTRKVPAVFLDRDGTICEEVGYLARPDQLRLIPGSAEAIAALNRAGILAIVTTNQSGVARGYFTEENVAAVHERLKGLLGEMGAKLDAIYYCPHHAEKGLGQYRVACDCRKPLPGMIRRAATEFDIDLLHSYVVGDKITDIEFGRNAGLRTVLVLSGYGREESQRLEAEGGAMPDFVANDLREAVSWILNDLQSKGVIEH